MACLMMTATNTTGDNNMFTIDAFTSVSFERGTLLIWTPDGITSADSHAEAVTILVALDIPEPIAIDAIHAAHAEAADYADAGY